MAIYMTDTNHTRFLSRVTEPLCRFPVILSLLSLPIPVFILALIEPGDSIVVTGKSSAKDQYLSYAFLFRSLAPDLIIFLKGSGSLKNGSSSVDCWLPFLWNNLR